MAWMWKPSARSRAASCPETVSRRQVSASISTPGKWKQCAPRGATLLSVTRCRACAADGGLCPQTPRPRGGARTSPCPGGRGEDGGRPGDGRRREPRRHAHGVLLPASPASSGHRPAPPEACGERPSCLLSLLGGRCPWLVEKSLQSLPLS